MKACRISGLAFILIALLFASVMGDAVTINQLSLDFDDGYTSFSDWGRADLEYTGSSSILYFNLLVDVDWRIENMAVHSVEGPAVDQEVTFLFPLGIPGGAPLDSIPVSWSLTLTPVTAFAGDREMLPVEQDFVSIRGAIDLEPYFYTPLDNLVGDAADGDKKVNPLFPNQNCGVGECVPAAVSNSLKFLKAKHGLDMEDADITIAKMKEATGWDPDTWCQANWPTLKDTYMQTNDYPVETTRTTLDMDLVKQKLGENCDIELTGRNHCVALVGLSKNANGTWTLTVRHDTKQGDETGDGGCIDEEVVYDPATGNLKGGTGLNGRAIRYFTIECPKEDTKSESTNWGRLKSLY